MDHRHPEGLAYHKALLSILAFTTFYNHLYENTRVYKTRNAYQICSWHKIGKYSKFNLTEAGFQKIIQMLFQLDNFCDSHPVQVWMQYPDFLPIRVACIHQSLIEPACLVSLSLSSGSGSCVSVPHTVNSSHLMNVCFILQPVMMSHIQRLKLTR